MINLIRNKNSKKKEEGFTLIEIVVSILILSIIIIATSSYFSNSVRFVQQTSIRSQALLIARMTIEEIKNEATEFEDWDDLASELRTIDIADDIFGNFDLLTNDYDIIIAISDIETDLKMIEVKVNWDSSNVQLETLITKR